MHVTLFHGVLAVVMIAAAIWAWIAYPRRARQLRDGLQAGMVSRAEAMAKNRRSYKRQRWLLLIGVILLPLGILGAIRGDWDGNITSIAGGLFTLTVGVVAFVCLRILDAPAQLARDSIS
jgi:pilus assembly protein TadC